MKYILKNYQETAVNNLLEITKTFLKIGWDTKEIIFKAPTWSGKTIIMASFLENLKNEDIWDFAFVWISVNKLHNQSKKSLENTLGIWAFHFYNLEDIREKLHKNDIVFINWESITKTSKKWNDEKWILSWAYTNIFMSENETGRNLPNFIDNTLKDDRKIILIIDESHIYLSDETEKLIKDTLKPALRIEVSATPKYPKIPTIEIKMDEVIESGMIKKEVIINEKFSELNLLETTSDEVIIKQWLEKREELKELYSASNTSLIDINPLVLIQIPGKNTKIDTLEKTEIEKIEKILQEKYNITRENGKLAIWLSDEKWKENKVNLENITESNNPVEVLIFKQAIATGWDCPRAQILIMFREIKSITFEIQTVGRIMRMPELHHYENDELNTAYVYTNFWKIEVEDGEASKYIKAKQAKIKKEFQNIILPNSIYLHRLDYNDLEPTADFHKLFYTVFLNEIWWVENEFITNIYDKFIEKVNINKEFKTQILLETKLIWLDEIVDYKTGFTKTDEKVIDFAFKKLLETYLSWLNKARSVWILKQSFYNFFNHYLAYKDKSHLEIQKIILTNSGFFAYIVEKTIKQFESIRIEHIEKKQNSEIYDFKIPEFEIFSEIYKKKDFKKSIQNPCYIKEDSKIEVSFIEDYLEKENNVEWWYKNGVSKKIYFWIFYYFEWKQRVFYPDFIVKYKSWKIGIFDPKDGNTANNMETKYKAESLQNYLKNKKDLFGGIIIKHKELFYLNQKQEYNFVNNNLSGWEKI